MLILSNYIAQKTLAWTSIHSWVTNSTTEELLYRLLFFASDAFNIDYIHQRDPGRAYVIARSKAVLTTLVGHNVRLIPDTPINASCFIHTQYSLMDDWRIVAAAFQRMNAGLKQYKYKLQPKDPYYLPGENPMDSILKAKEVLIFDGHEIQLAFMPMPVLSILYPIFR